MRLSELLEGESGKVVKISTSPRTTKRLSDLGLTEGSVVTLVRFAPFNDPLEISLRGFYLALRKSDADKIHVELNYE